MAQKKNNDTLSWIKQSEPTYNKSAVTDHASQLDHVMTWEECKIKCREDHTFMIRSGVTEALHLTHTMWSNVMNNDQGRHQLWSVYTFISQMQYTR